MDNEMKYCPSCGKKLPENTLNFCQNCGARLNPNSSPVISKCVPAKSFPVVARKRNAASNRVGFGKAISLFWSRYFDFGGKSSRAEFWWVVLFLFLVNFVLALLPAIISVLWIIFTFIPTLSLMCRRFRDANAAINFWVIFVLQTIAWFVIGSMPVCCVYGYESSILIIALLVSRVFLLISLIYNFVIFCSPSVGVLEKGNSVPETVKIPGRDFSIGKFPVTRQEYFDVMGKDPSESSEFKLSSVLPVECVSWNDAVAFCEKLTKYAREKGLIKNNQSYRLPTSEEWEYACRAGTTTKYCSGDSKEDLSRVGWWFENSGDKTHPVGEKEPNAWGIYDMHGNVWEWCQDSKGSYRVYCGGGYYSDADYCESSSVRSYDPDHSCCDLGFRVVLAPEKTGAIEEK